MGRVRAPSEPSERLGSTRRQGAHTSTTMFSRLDACGHTLDVFGCRRAGLCLGRRPSELSPTPELSTGFATSRHRFPTGTAHASREGIAKEMEHTHSSREPRERVGANAPREEESLCDWS